MASRIVSVCLQLNGNYPSGSQQFVSIVSVYTPNHRALPEVKEKFYDDLQAVINSVPSSDVSKLIQTSGMPWHLQSFTVHYLV